MVTELPMRSFGLDNFGFCLLKGRGEVHPDFLVKLDFKIADDQKFRARDQTIEGVLDSGCPPVPVGQPRPFFGQFLAQFCQIMLKTMLWGAEL